MDRDDQVHRWPVDPETARRQIETVVKSVLHPSELTGVELHWAPRHVPLWNGPPPTAGPYQSDLVITGEVVAPKGEDSLHVRVTAGPESFEMDIWPAPTSWATMVASLADALEDWVAESRFAWGQQRRATLPDDL
jgi:hypothetical protein